MFGPKFLDDTDQDSRYTWIGNDDLEWDDGQAVQAALDQAVQRSVAGDLCGDVRDEVRERVPLARIADVLSYLRSIAGPQQYL